MNKKVWDEILTRATTGMNLEDMMLSEISQTQKYKYYMILGFSGKESGKESSSEDSAYQ